MDSYFEAGGPTCLMFFCEGAQRSVPVEATDGG